MKTYFGSLLKSVMVCDADDSLAGAELRLYLDGWTDDELDVLGVVAERLNLGREHYGGLDLRTDARPLPTEIGEEFVDAGVYGAMLLLKRGVE